MPEPVVDPRYLGPWPLVSDLVRAELRIYLEAVSAPEIQTLPTRCAPWTVHDITAHLAATFWRYASLLEQSHRGDFTPPFARAELSEENLKAVAEFSGDPSSALAEQAARFVDAVTDASEPMAHQYGPIPTGLQMLFALNELAIHHDDVAAASGNTYRPGAEVIDALLPMWDTVLELTDPDIEDPWERIVRASGR